MKSTVFGRFLAAAALSALIGISPASGGDGNTQLKSDESHFINHFDQDGDGRVSAAEFAGGHEDRFSRMDRNGDGYLDAGETPSRSFHGRSSKEKLMSKFDIDVDGQLSSEEFPGPANRFATLDTDADGVLSATELLAGRPGPGKGGKCFAKDDADGDGNVSKEEFSGPESCFNRLDADGDGSISPEEARPGNRDQTK